MNPMDTETLGVDLCLKWPGKFQESDVAYWAKQLDGYQIEAIRDALTVWKNTNKFCPKVHDIKGRLGGPAKPITPQSGHREETRASIFRRQMVQAGDVTAGHQSDAEIYLRFHAKVAYHGAMRQPNPGAPPTRVLSDSYRHKVISECVTDLLSAGVEEESSKAFAEAIVDPALTGDFMRQLLDDLRNHLSSRAA